MKFLKMLKNYIKENYYLIIFVFAIFLCEVLLRLYCGLGNGNGLLSKTGLFLNFLFLVLIVSILCLFKEKPKKIISFVVLAIYAFYSFAQTVHFLFFRTFFSFRKLTVINELNSVMDEVIMKFKWEHLLFLLPLIIYLFVILKFKTNNKNYNIKSSLLVLCFSIIVFLTGTLLFDYQMDKRYSGDLNNDAYLYKEFSSNKDYYDRFGSFSYITKDLNNIAKQTNSNLSSDEIKEIDEFINNLNDEKDNNSAIYEGKNLIFILCESLSNKAIDEKLTPTLYKMAQQGTYYSNFYAPLYPSNTCDSEFIALTGMIPSIEYGTTSKTFADNYYPYALPYLFKEKGYEVNSYHSFEKTFYNREQLHYSFGFNYFYDRNDLGIYTEDGTDYINWPDDSELFEKMMENTNIEKPFFDFCISVSGHLPYFIEREELWANYSKVIENYPDTPEAEAFYYAAQMKLDEGLEELLNTLEEKNILDNTIIVLFGDHYPYGLDDETLKDMYGDTDSYEIYKTPMIIYDGANNGEGENNKLTSTFDLYPTIVSLFNLNDNGAFIVGKDINSNKKEEMVLFSDYSVLSNDFYYNASNGLLTGVDKDNLLDLSKKYYKYSQMMLLGNYYKTK